MADERTLTDDEITTQRVAEQVTAAQDDSQDTGDDAADTGDDSGDTADTSDTGDDSGDASDTGA